VGMKLRCKLLGSCRQSSQVNLQRSHAAHLSSCKEFLCVHRRMYATRNPADGDSSTFKPHTLVLVNHPAGSV
jgi:hypothetical protein